VTAEVTFVISLFFSMMEARGKKPREELLREHAKEKMERTSMGRAIEDESEEKRHLHILSPGLDLP
jgi:hypothetical protein